MERKRGMVAMLDILGYSSLIENNDVGENAYKILDIIASLPKQRIEKEIASCNNVGDMTILYHLISTLVFSDTILVTFEIDDSYGVEEKTHYWELGLFYLSGLFKAFLDNGFPLRGAVSYGEYITHQYCFAGKPIINAYKTGNNLDSAGILMDEYALAEVVNCSTQANIQSKKPLAFEKLEGYFKNKRIQESYFVSISPHYSQEERIKLSNQRELAIYLTSSFTAYNKGLTEGAKLKLDNTIELFEKVFKHREELTPATNKNIESNGA